MFVEATAAAIGAPIDFRVLSRARLVGRSTGEVGSPLTFEQAVLTALEKNFDLRIRREATESARQSEQLAGSAVAPQVAATYGFQRIDRDRAMLSGGLYPETAQRAGLAPRAEDWPWSSVRVRLLGKTEEKPMLSPWPVAEPPDYLKWLNHSQGKEEIAEIREAIKRIRPYGSEKWTAKAVRRFGVESTTRSRGRPPKGS